MRSGTSFGSWETALATVALSAGDSAIVIAIGSDLAMMAALTSHGRPLFGRPTREIVLNPLTVAEVGDLLGPTDLVDALH